MKQTNKFRFFAPTSELVKGKDKNGNEVYKVGGIISDASQDSDGENLDPQGFDLSEFSFINWNHSKAPKDIIGEPETWKYVPGKGLHMEGYIYPDSQTGKEAVELMKVLNKSKRGNKLGWSVEGQVIERDIINPKIVKKAKITAVALCPFPKNGNTFAELIQKGFTGEDVYQDNDQLEYEGVNGGDGFIIDHIDSAGDRIQVTKGGEIVITKCMNTTNGRPLIPESVEGNPKKQIQKAVIAVVEGHKKGLCTDDEIKKIIPFKNFLE